jgi:hypothetical protein
MTSKVKGSEGIEFPDGTVQSSAARSKQGVTDGSNAAAGQIGEYISVTGTNLSALTSTVMSIAASITLQPGDWEVQGIVGVLGSGSTTITLFGVDVVVHVDNPTSFSPDAVQLALNNAIAFGGAAFRIGTVVERFNITTPTTIDLLARAYFTGAAISIADSRIWARRVR